MEDYIKNNFSAERALYGKEDLILVECSFSGEEDGESAIKEANNVETYKTFFDLRYPLWHCKKIDMKECNLSKNCRAPLWYCKDINIYSTEILGVKALRESKNILLDNCKISSEEFCWKNKLIKANNISVEGNYSFFECQNMDIDEMYLNGKYSFQYVKNVKIANSNFDTKDAFWHSTNVTLRNCVINGEYLGWYSKGLTLINCKIKGTQPLCYCENLKLINCEMEDCDLAFEYSSVKATIKGKIKSIKNPKKGKIVVDYVEKVYITDDSKYPCKAYIDTKNGLN